MTDKTLNGKSISRLVLAPHLSPSHRQEAGGGSESADGGKGLNPPAAAGPFFYLSWPGWEIYLRRRLGLNPDELNAVPLLLPDISGPEKDFAAIDQMARTAETLGAGFLGLLGSGDESARQLAGAIRAYGGESPAPGPILDDRTYLALWTISEHQLRQSEILLAGAAAREKAMWAALKGEEDPDETLTGDGPPQADGDLSLTVGKGLDKPAFLDSRKEYAWQCWRRLAEALLGPDDVVIFGQGR